MNISRLLLPVALALVLFALSPFLPLSETLRSLAAGLLGGCLAVLLMRRKR